MSKSYMNGRRLLGAVATCLLVGGWSMSSFAADCTVENWTGSEGLSNGNVGTQGAANRRYAGPCGLRVALDGTARYLTDASPENETQYIARFYTFLDEAGTAEVLIYSANNAAGDGKAEVWYNSPNSSDMTLRVFDTGGSANDLTFQGMGSGWHSVEFSWTGAEDAAIAFTVNGAEDQTIDLDTSGISIASAQLGNINAASGNGSIDFDDFDSRRSTRPGRLCRGLTDPARSGLDFDDVLAIFAEVGSAGGTPAPGQPDYNQDGVIDFDDVLGVFGRIASGNEDCSVNR